MNSLKQKTLTLSGTDSAFLLQKHKSMEMINIQNYE